jgi:porin
MQAVNEDWQLTFGKINTFDLLNTIYPQTGRGIDGFMNASTFLPLTVARTLPLSFLGAGILKLHEGQIQGSLLVYDNHNVPTTSGFDELFDNGASVAALWRLFTDVGGLPGSHLFLGTWANGTYDSLDPIDWAFVPGVGLVAPQDTGTWSATYILEQKLWVDCCCPNRHIGLLSQLGFADPETSPYEWVCNVGLQAQGLVAGRPRDTLGVGYFYSGLSDDLKSLVSPVIPLGDLQGGEFYYNATIRPWCHVTADLQVVNPADERNNTALVLGMRASIDL